MDIKIGDKVTYKEPNSYFKEKVFSLIISNEGYIEIFTAGIKKAKNEADYIEIHTNGQNKNLVDVFKYLKKQFNGDLGICISQNNNVKEKIEIIETVKNIIFPKKLIVQADGNPISGLNDSVATTQKAIEEAQNFQCIENIILILSGGTNAQTAKLANEKKLHFDGIAWGSFARKILDEKDSYKKAVNLLATLK